MNLIVPTLTEGDVFARWRVKVLEIFESLKIIEQAIEQYAERTL